MSRLRPANLRQTSKTLNYGATGTSNYYYSLQLKQQLALKKALLSVGKSLVFPSATLKKGRRNVLQPAVLPLNIQLRAQKYLTLQTTNSKWFFNKTLCLASIWLDLNKSKFFETLNLKKFSQNPNFVGHPKKPIGLKLSQGLVAFVSRKKLRLIKIFTKTYFSSSNAYFTFGSHGVASVTQQSWVSANLNFKTPGYQRTLNLRSVRVARPQKKAKKSAKIKFNVSLKPLSKTLHKTNTKQSNVIESFISHGKMINLNKHPRKPHRDPTLLTISKSLLGLPLKDNFKRLNHEFKSQNQNFVKTLLSRKNIKPSDYCMQQKLKNVGFLKQACKGRFNNCKCVGCFPGLSWLKFSSKKNLMCCLNPKLKKKRLLSWPRYTTFSGNANFGFLYFACALISRKNYDVRNVDFHAPKSKSLLPLNQWKQKRRRSRKAKTFYDFLFLTQLQQPKIIDYSIHAVSRLVLKKALFKDPWLCVVEQTKTKPEGVVKSTKKNFKNFVKFPQASQANSTQLTIGKSQLGGWVTPGQKTKAISQANLNQKNQAPKKPQLRGVSPLLELEREEKLAFKQIHVLKRSEALKSLRKTPGLTFEDALQPILQSLRLKFHLAHGFNRALKLNLMNFYMECLPFGVKQQFRRKFARSRSKNLKKVVIAPNETQCSRLIKFGLTRLKSALRFELNLGLQNSGATVSLRQTTSLRL